MTGVYKLGNIFSHQITVEVSRLTDITMASRILSRFKDWLKDTDASFRLFIAMYFLQLLFR